jgi:hypothetical protein
MKRPELHVSVPELLVFIALLIPTFLVLAAAVVSLVRPDPTIADPRPAQTTAACEPCSKPAPTGDAAGR